MVDNQKFKLYTDQADWQKFFTAMKSIVDSICRKTGKLEEDLENTKWKYQGTYAEKEEYALKYREEKESKEKIQIDYETLERDVAELFKVEKKFNEMKGRMQELKQKLESKEQRIAAFKPKLY